MKKDKELENTIYRDVLDGSIYYSLDDMADYGEASEVEYIEYKKVRTVKGKFELKFIETKVSK
jgi:hypothetical protein